MKTKRKIPLLTALLAFANALPAAGSLTFAVGGTFSLKPYVTSTAGETITGLDYYLNTDTAGSGLLSITGRTYGTCSFNFLN